VKMAMNLRAAQTAENFLTSYITISLERTTVLHEINYFINNNNNNNNR
jgi:hypothetical protein